YGRLEDGGLRCSFHGWLSDVDGKCLQTPAEPAGSRLCEHVRLRAYPVQEKSGILFAYLGEGEAPAFPHFDAFVAPSEYTFAFKGYWYSIFTSFGAPVDKDTMRNQRLKIYPAPDYKPIHGRGNGWGFDAGEQRTQTFTGMGFDINIHDQWACESQGPIADRTRENLG